MRSGLVSLLYVMFMASCLQAQQVMPRFVRRITPPATINFNTVGVTQDARGNLWFATNEGVVRFDGRQFRVYHDPVLGQGDDYFHVIPSPDGRIWCKLGRGSVLSYVDPHLDRIVRVPDSSRLVRDYLSQWRSNYVFADADAKLWIGLRRRGLVRFDPRTYAVEKVFDKEGEAVRWITQDRQGNIWFTTNDGVYAYHPNSGLLKHYRDELGAPDRRPNNETFALGIHARQDGTVLVGLTNEVDVIHPVTGQITHLALIPTKSYPDQAVHDFYDDPQGNTYFSTYTACYRYTRWGELQQLEFSGIRHPVKCVFPDRNNRLWVSTNEALFEYDLSHIRPVPALNLVDVLINGTQLNVPTDEQQLVRDSLGLPTLTVREGDLITLHVSPYVENITRAFRLRLDGYDRRWNVVEDATNTVAYELPAGSYTLLLNQFNNPAGWEKNPSRLSVVVRPLFWKTGWFRGVVLTIVVSAAIVLLRGWSRRRKLRRELVRREFEAATLRELDELKSRFFTNITHELRTPLTIILNGIDQLSHAPLDEPNQKQLQSVQRSAQQLMRLINETLDIAKLDAGKLDRREHVGEPVDFVQQVVAQFTDLATQRQIDLRWKGDVPADTSVNDEASQRLYGFDDDKLEKITYNLLSNALKFTPAHGQVIVDTRISSDHNLLLRVTDTGIGIPADQLPRIFERFHQIDSSLTRAYSGTGIGLALVKELTDWLGGTVHVESTVGEGSTFTVSVPLTPHTTVARVESIHPLPEPVRQSTERVGTALIVKSLIQANGRPISKPSREKNQPLLLLVEDNEELRSYLSSHLATSYRVMTAENGRLGLEQALADIPDLIISDVMMPELDGYELVERLKADDRTSHIPIVLLTAKSSYESRMKGLGAGADDYMGKPFSVEELNLRISNVLRTRQNWQRRLTTGQAPHDSRPPSDLRLDKEERFLARLRSLILDHLTDEAVDVDWLTTQAGMSRTQLHRKLIALTNQSATHFIHSVRLEKAVTLLQTGELNVAQVAQAVGYSSQSYFSKVFQEQFGYPPMAIKV
ncbi:hybrid sensor histidine kinase/response regulator transcription factor [Spirosoma validum]|uniref:histidine kinase n=1 Tax=Spirosoma validum TaxID=2771355 RepID=A0A927GF22_9BACT|nr:ATP-binding protein [Spirosoma validum]MBD2755200.1 response regulator [Spirosoma validum]